MKILIADPHPEVQSALRLIVMRIPPVSEVSEASSLVQLLAECTRSCPDLILLDLDLIQPARTRTQNLADLIHVVQRLCPCSRVVVLSSRLEMKQEVLATGANGFISKTDLPEAVLAGILQVLENRS